MIKSASILKDLNSQINGFLYFTGSLLRWPPQKPLEFLYYHLYILIVYFLFWSTGLGLILVVGAIAPLCLGLSKGLSLNCLSYEAAVAREFADQKQY